jgi:hypothetical protein
LNFVAILTALDALASRRVEGADPARYQSLPLNNSRLLHTLIVNARVEAGTGVPAFTGDIGIGATRVVRERGGVRRIELVSRIEDLGDLRVYGALETIEATGLTAIPSVRDDVQEGDQIELPDWSSWKGATLTVGGPGRVLLVRPVTGTDRRARIERIVEPRAR